MRKEFQLTPEEKAELLAAMRPVPMIMLQCGEPPSPQDNANRAWMSLGEKRGFKGMTVQASERGENFFTAEETDGNQVATQSSGPDRGSAADVAGPEPRPNDAHRLRAIAAFLRDSYCGNEPMMANDYATELDSVASRIE